MFVIKYTNKNNTLNKILRKIKVNDKNNFQDITITKTITTSRYVHIIFVLQQRLYFIRRLKTSKLTIKYEKLTGAKKFYLIYEKRKKNIQKDTFELLLANHYFNTV